jgi:hypothetical protein
MSDNQAQNTVEGRITGDQKRPENLNKLQISLFEDEVVEKSSARKMV